jgi:hypothetical protein
MPVYEQVANAGNVAGQNVYRVRFGGSPCSDVPQLQAWDDYQMSATASESLAGTAGNGFRSLVAAAHTTGGPVPEPWVPAAATPGGDVVNRLRGTDSFCLLGASAPAADESRTFQLAFGVAQDSAPGTAGHQPVIAVKVFYAGAPPVVGFDYNVGTDMSPTWEAMTSGVKGVPMAMGVRNTIHATGPGTTTTSLDPVTKPGAGEKWAEGQWVMVSL